MTGLEFRESSFDYRGRHQIPEDTFLHTYYRDRERRLTVKNLHEDFLKSDEADCFSNVVGDYVKAANLLFFYRMLACPDPDKLIQPWACKLVCDEEAWNRFEWGAYSYALLQHQMGVIATSRDQFKGRILYHAYGPIWVLQAWSYEAIPELGRMCAHQGCAPGVIPRCLRWVPKSVGREIQFILLR